MKYTLVIDVQSYDEIGRETVHHHCAAMLSDDMWNLVRIAERLYSLITLIYHNRDEKSKEENTIHDIVNRQPVRSYGGF